jgi:hypothetical protein
MILRKTQDPRGNVRASNEKFLGEFGGAIGRAVVDHDQLGIGPKGLEVAEKGEQIIGQPPFLVKRGNDDSQSGWVHA